MCSGQGYGVKRVKADLLRGSCILVMKNRQKNPAERTGSRYKIEILMSRKQKLKGLVADSLGVKMLNDNPYLGKLLKNGKLNP